MFLGFHQARWLLSNGPEPEKSHGGNNYLVGLGIFIKPKSLEADGVDVGYINIPQEDLPTWKFIVLPQPYFSKGGPRITYLESNLEMLLQIQISDLLNLEYLILAFTF